MKVRDSICNRGDFVMALVEFFDHPNDIHRLKKAFDYADLNNRAALTAACEKLFPADGLFSLQSLFSFMSNLGYDETREPFKAQFDILAHLDDDVENPFKIPTRH